MHLHAERLSADTRDWGDVTQKVVIESFKKGRVDCVPHGGQEQRMAIPWRKHDGFGGDIAAGPRAVLDDEWLAEPVGQPLSEKPRKDVGRTTRCKADDDAHRPRRIGLRPCDVRHSWERGSAGGQMQELSSVGKFHPDPSLSTSLHSITSSARASKVGGTSISSMRASGD